MADKGLNKCSCEEIVRLNREQTEAESFAMTMLKSNIKTSKLTIYVLSTIIILLIGLLIWKDWNYKQLIENATFETAATTYEAGTGYNGGNAIINDTGEVNINGESFSKDRN